MKKKFESQYEFSPLHIACKNGYQKIVEYLVSYGANVDECDIIGRVPIFFAAENGDLFMFMYLIQKGAYKYWCDDDYYDLLHIAAFSNNAQLVQYINDLEYVVNSVDSYYRTPLHMAINESNDSFLTVKCLVENDANIEAKAWEYYYDVTPLMDACLYGQYDVIKLLIDHGAKVNSWDSNNQTALFYFLNDLKKETIELFIQKRIDINAKSCDGSTVLHKACEKDLCEFVRILISKGANIND